MRNDLIPTDVPGYFKDPKTKLIINNNDKEYERVKMAREIAKQKRNEIEILTHRVTNLETDISDIKNMLIQLLQK